MNVSINKAEVNKMTFAEKIINLRKQKGWSQEELAEKLDVTRQSVSKWESAGAMPDIAKILQLSELFGVTTDYLLKDNDGEVLSTDEKVEPTEHKEEKSENVRKISEKEAYEYLEASRKAAKKIAFAVFLCIISPACMLLLMGACESQMITAISEDICALIGIVVLLLIVAAAVMIFIFFGLPLTKFDYMEKEAVTLEEAAKNAIEREKETATVSYIRHNAAGVALCILGAISTLLGAFTEHEMLVMAGICGTLLLCACGVYSFVKVGVPWGAMQKMLEEGDYTRRTKRANRAVEPVSGAYWLFVTAVYLLYSFATFEWHRSWIIWPVAGVIFAVLRGMIEAVTKNDK